MLPLPLHGTIDRHDGIAVLVVAATILLGSFLASLRRRQRRMPPPARTRGTDAEPPAGAGS